MLMFQAFLVLVVLLTVGQGYLLKRAQTLRISPRQLTVSTESVFTDKGDSLDFPRIVRLQN